MTELASRAHMRQQPEVKPVAKVEAIMEPKVERVETVRESAYESVGVKDIAWDSYYDFINAFSLQSQMGALRCITEPAPDASKTHTVINMRVVERQPYIDDFADMMRNEDFDNHTRLEQYQSPVNPSSRIDWFAATMLATMIENGRIGLKVGATGNREIYINRARTGNIFFRVWGGRTTLLIAIAQWFLLDQVWDAAMTQVSTQQHYDVYMNLVGVVFCAVAVAYHSIHWRFYKRYSFPFANLLIDGVKSRTAPNSTDVSWAVGRVAVHAINLACFSGLLVYLGVGFLKNVGWL